MTATVDERSTALSSLVEFREMSLAEMAASDSVQLEIVGRIFPETPIAPVAVAAFNSAI
jgi:FXSXX-COOH protein